MSNVPTKAQMEPHIALMDNNTLRQQWESAARTLAEVKAWESAFRVELVKRYLPTTERGTNYGTLENGERLKVVQPYTYKVENDREKLEDVYEKFSRVSNEATFLFTEVVSWKPEVSASKFEALPDELKALLAPLITSKPGSAQVSIVPAKD